MTRNEKRGYAFGIILCFGCAILTGWPWAYAFIGVGAFLFGFYAAHRYPHRLGDNITDDVEAP